MIFRRMQGAFLKARGKFVTVVKTIANVGCIDIIIVINITYKLRIHGRGSRPRGTSQRERRSCGQRETTTRAAMQEEGTAAAHVVAAAAARAVITTLCSHICC